MNKYKNFKKFLGEELFDSIMDIREDFGRLELLSSLCTSLIAEKRETDFEAFKDLLLNNENVLISINGSKYLNRFSDFIVEYNEEENTIDIGAEILNGSIGRTVNCQIYDVVKKDSFYFCEDLDSDNLVIKIVIAHPL